MDKITLIFSVDEFPMSAFQPEVTLTIDENGKHCFIEPAIVGLTMKGEEVMPARVMKAFNETAIKKILSYDEIPVNEEVFILDGNTYTFTITKGEETISYEADEETVNYFPLFRYLASWYRNYKVSMRAALSERFNQEKK